MASRKSGKPAAEAGSLSAVGTDTSALLAKSAPPKRRTLTSELMEWLWESKKWWMLPIVLVFLLLCLLLFLGTATPLAPFIYPLF